MPHRRLRTFTLWTGTTLRVPIAAAFLVWSLKHWQEVILSPIVTIRFTVPLIAVAVLTLLVWRFVPNFPCGHCRRCGYNLTGNRSGVCSECGVEVHA